MSWKSLKIPDEKYFSIGNAKNYKELVVSQSWLKEVFKFGLYPVLNGFETFGDNTSKQTERSLKIGTAFHCMLLEGHDVFMDRYSIGDIEKGKITVSHGDYVSIKDMVDRASKMYPTDANLQESELAFLGKYEDVNVKLKVDKINNILGKNGGLVSVEIVDVKTVWFDPYSLYRSPTGERKGLKKMLFEQLHYDLQAFFYTKMIEEYLVSMGIHVQVDFSFLLVSIDNEKIMKVRCGADVFETGKMKFDTVWNDVREYALSGYVSDVEIL